ncbi:cGMP-dependent 3',5'-cyclic phosphodiesterase isoform X1, partial [Tachysurus ichikawai]
LQKETQSQCCCLLLVSEDNHQLFCQVVGDKVLEEEISFPLMFGRFGQVVEKKKSITLQDVSQKRDSGGNTVFNIVSGDEGDMRVPIHVLFFCLVSEPQSLRPSQLAAWCSY